MYSLRLAACVQRKRRRHKGRGAGAQGPGARGPGPAPPRFELLPRLALCAAAGLLPRSALCTRCKATGSPLGSRGLCSAAHSSCAWARMTLSSSHVTSCRGGSLCHFSMPLLPGSHCCEEGPLARPEDASPKPAEGSTDLCLRAEVSLATKNKSKTQTHLSDSGWRDEVQLHQRPVQAWQTMIHHQRSWNAIALY